jgi:phosphatidylserine decarboxylase
MFWRRFWFFRNPKRRCPEGENIVSPADGRIVYVKQIQPQEPVLSIKDNRPVRINDIVREDLDNMKVLIGVFMSPFNVHYNRAPISGRLAFVRHYPAVVKNYHMTSMHWRSLFKRFPIYGKSLHILHNERTVTKITGKFKDAPLSCYVVQIAGGSVRGIDSYVHENAIITKGKIFGMIRIGSQVDIILPWRESMVLKVAPGQSVRGGETILIE